MQLKQLKLSGFKSFVDPTIVPFSSQLVAVVGPNGCGKSNIIDAVRWVMGEGSAKTLRGESMADVIFNGSSDRKPVGQASVELVFDNSLGRFSGPYASYQEMSIKRVVTRDGDSYYYLNGTRCRRRDITDLFLGTGAGTRGYSIIGQNTISQIVEAKPEDLRAYLEEAAGVSKYKERRRETVQRIQQTRDNLARVHDICNELDTQLNRLERQAKAAERYKALKHEERECKRDIVGLKWCGLTREREQAHQEINQLLLTREEYQAQLAHIENSLVTLETEIVSQQVAFQSTQSAYYQVGNEVARLEEAQQQQHREKQQLEADTLQVKADLQSAELQRQQDSVSYQLAQDEWVLLAKQTDELKETFEQLTQVWRAQQQQASELNQKKQDIQALLNQTQHDGQVATLNKQHTEKRYQETLARLEKIEQDRVQCHISDGVAILDELAQQQESASLLFEQLSQQQSDLVHQGKSLADQIQEIERQLRGAQDTLQQHKVEHAALKASIQSALKGATPVSAEVDGVRLLTLIQVEAQWRFACEWVLGDALHALTFDSLDAVMPSLSDSQGQMTTWITSNPMVPANDGRLRLSDKVQGYQPAWINPLHHIFLAETLADAIAQLPLLEPTQSVMTPDGFWLGQGWVRVADVNPEDDVSLLTRQQTLQTLTDILLTDEETLQSILDKRDHAYALRASNDNEQQTLKWAWTEAQQNLQETKARYQQQQLAINQADQQASRLQRESDELHPMLETLAADRLRFEETLLFSQQRSEEYDYQLEALTAEKGRWDETLNTSRKQVDDARDLLHQTELKCNREQLKAQQLNETMLREQARIEKQQERLESLLLRLDKLNTPDEAAVKYQFEAIERHQHLESELNAMRQQLDALQVQLQSISQSKQLLVQRDHAIQEQMVKLQMTEQTLIARIEALLESASALEMVMPLTLEQWSMDETVESRESQLAEIADKIKRLGAINLMAIDEYQTSLVRKTHLDDQSRDLNEALATLETAIAKMDEETHSRLEETYMQVNALFQTLFPRLFGGGHARLQLTCDNLLEAGIIVMAQPPGKRNSSIHLLSGGEKAMTAVALVFAIFQLNPSPFCMLDEVDAPLDDLNVGRFCDLVREMSQTVQFLLITHNKVTMELAEHLIGVTMREPGVSRIVAVDVAMALD